MSEKYNCANCDEVIADRRAAILKKDLADRKPWSLPVERWLCLACQEGREEKGLDGRPVPTEAMAISGEADDSTRDTELGWGPLTIRRPVIKERLIA